MKHHKRVIRHVTEHNQWYGFPILGVIILGLLVAIASQFQVVQRKERDQKVVKAVDGLKKLPVEAVASEAALQEVQTFIELSKEESPTFGYIRDIKTLKKIRPFFNKAQNGDLLIMYPNKTIIYDPVNRVIRDIASVGVLEYELQ